MKYLLLKNINISSLFTVLGIVALLAVVFAVLIVWVSKLCAVKTDEKAEAIKEKLAGANCGGCGYAGCADFAKALAEGKAQVTSCGPTAPENKAEIAKILGVEFSAGEEKIAVVHCCGGNNAINKFNYVGNKNCALECSFMGGRKACLKGCLGEGTCESLCPNGAIKTENDVAKVDKSKCTACGLCVKNCPKTIIELVPKSAVIYVACSSNCKGKEVMDACKTGCIGCGLCAKSCPQGAINMVDNLPQIDYSKCTGCKTCVTKCPKKCIKEI